ncbi:hypothetical protein A0H81_00445 [Grifola frondosa]|uniref:Uncharacterized protein n=1 Tax=Grifola frondosa TaxID=5627 RepID=A0A1C7MUA6_GRIFR|nr:hypothetical protein A0H81_00445 [Grifola frondosa]
MADLHSQWAETNTVRLATLGLKLLFQWGMIYCSQISLTNSRSRRICDGAAGALGSPTWYLTFASYHTINFIILVVLIVVGKE